MRWIICIIVSSLGASCTPTNTLQRWYVEGVQHQESGDYAAADAAYTRIREKAPDFPGIRNNQAVLLAHRDDLPTAVAAIEAAIVSDADDTTARLNQIRLLLLQNETELALRKARSFAARFPEHADAHLLLGLLLLRSSNDTEGALHALTFAQENGQRSTVAEASFLRAILHANAERYAEAAADFAEVTRHRRDAVAHYNRALMLEHAGDRRGALESLRLSAALDPAAAAVPYLEAVLLLRAGQLDEAAEALERTEKLDANRTGLSHLRGLLHFLREDWTAAIAALEAAIESERANGRIYYNLALARVRADDLAGAHAAFSEAATLDPEDAQAAAHRDTLGQLLGL